MRVIHPCCAGLDVHKRTVTACLINLDLTPSTLVQWSYPALVALPHFVLFRDGPDL